ncbi:MAG: uroporphyrinogen decarboxylase family protein [Armatimonadota bacterium]
MNGRERVLAALAGERQELAAGFAYPEVPLRDRCEDETGAPWWVFEESNPDVVLPIVREYLARVQCDWWQILWTPSRARRAQLQYSRDADGKDYLLDLATGACTRIYPPWLTQGEAKQARQQYTDDECLARVEIVRAEEQLAEGWWDFGRAVKQELGADYFLYSYSSVPFSLSFQKGYEETLMDVAANPAFLHRMADRIVEKQREYFQAMAQVGVDGLWVQEFFTGAETLSRRQYEEIVLPHGKELFAEAQRAGLKVIHYFMGNASDRADLIADMGAEMLLFEEGRKGYSADLETLAAQIRRDDMALIGNLASEGVLEQGNDSDLQAEIEALVTFGKRRGRFLFATGSPPTPQTSWTRLRQASEMAREAWSKSALLPTGN